MNTSLALGRRSAGMANWAGSWFLICWCSISCSSHPPVVRSSKDASSSTGTVVDSVSPMGIGGEKVGETCGDGVSILNAVFGASGYDNVL
jgi:hypothetical protein